MPSSDTSARVARLARRRDRAREELLDAARAVLGRGGVAGTTIEAVSEAAGVSKAAIYYYFASKEDLLRALVVDAQDAEMRAVADAVAVSPAGPPALGGLVRAFCGHHLPLLERFRLVYVWSQLVVVRKEDLDRSVNPRAMATFDVAEERLRAGGPLRAGAHPRRLVLGAWSSALGLVTTASLLDASGVRFLHRWEDLVDDVAATAERGAR